MTEPLEYSASMRLVNAQEFLAKMHEGWTLHGVVVPQSNCILQMLAARSPQGDDVVAVFAMDKWALQPAPGSQGAY